MISLIKRFSFLIISFIISIVYFCAVFVSTTDFAFKGVFHEVIFPQTDNKFRCIFTVPNNVDYNTLASQQLYRLTRFYFLDFSRIYLYFAFYYPVLFFTTIAGNKEKKLPPKNNQVYSFIIISLTSYSCYISPYYSLIY